MPKYKITGTNPHTGNQTTHLIRADNQSDAQTNFEKSFGELKDLEIEQVDDATGNRAALLFYSIGQVISVAKAVLSFALIIASFLITPASAMEFVGVSTNGQVESTDSSITNIQIIFFVQILIGIVGILFWTAMFLLFNRVKKLTMQYL